MKTLCEHLYESLLGTKDAESSIEPITMINNWCKDNVKGQYEIDKKTFIINSLSDIKIIDRSLTEFPSYIHFGIVNGSFYCDKCASLKSLKGAPKKVGRDFSCNFCTSLESLEGAPEKARDFSCNNCDSLKSLEGAPKMVDGCFYCNSCNSLKSLEGAPKEVGGNFECSSCPLLTSLEGISERINGKIYSDIR